MVSEIFITKGEVFEADIPKIRYFVISIGFSWLCDVASVPGNVSGGNRIKIVF